MKLYQFETITSGIKKTVGIIPFVSNSFIQDTVQENLKNADTVILTVWKEGGFEVESVEEFSHEVKEEKSNEEIILTVSNNGKENIHTLTQGSETITRKSKTKKYACALVYVHVATNKMCGVFGYRTDISKAENDYYKQKAWQQNNEPEYTVKLVEVK